MRWDAGMFRRGLAVLGIAAVITGWTVYTADQVVREVGRTVAFGLKPFAVDVNRAAKGDRYRRPVGLYLGPYLGWEHNAII